MKEPKIIGRYFIGGPLHAQYLRVPSIQGRVDVNVVSSSTCPFHEPSIEELLSGPRQVSYQLRIFGYLGTMRRVRMFVEATMSDYAAWNLAAKEGIV